MAKLSDKPLEFLYGLTKITSTAEKAIVEKENFSKISLDYCNKVCKTPCKNKEQVQLENRENLDLVIIQDHTPNPDKYKDSNQLSRIHFNIFKYLIDKHIKGCNWAVLNSLKCGPNKQDLKIKNVDIQRCSPYLRSELSRIKPKVILCTGTFSSKALGVDKSVYTNRGEIHNSDFGPVVHTLHPKSLLMLRQNASGQFWGPDYFSCLEKDIIKASEIIGGKQPSFSLLENIERVRREHITICETNEDVQRVVSLLLSMPKNRIISFDTETTGLDPWDQNAKLLCIQFGWLEEGIEKAAVIPLWHRENKTINPDKAWDEVVKVLLDPIFKVTHHGKFDIKYIYCTKGIRVQNVVFDTMLLLHELNSGIQGNYGLKRAAWDYMWDTGIAGYEDLLPSLSKEKEIEEDESIDEENISDISC